MRRLVPILMLVLVVGCGRRLEFEKTFAADNGGQKYDLDPTRAEQKLKVVASATDGKIDVYIFLAKNASTVKFDVDKKKMTDVIAFKEDVDSAELMATIPPNEESTVWVRAHTLKEANVKLRITN